MAFTSKTIPISLTALALVIGLPTCVYGGTHIDLGLGENRFFLGERFLITFKDVVYWVAGMCMGLLFATTFIFITDYDGALTMMQGKKVTSSRNRSGANGKEEGDSETSRGARLIGSKKYPTQVEERVLQAIHTEPENYISRQGRLIGAKQLPIQIEEHLLTKLESPENSFTEQEADVTEDQPIAVSQLLKVLFSLPSSDEHGRR